MGDQRLHPDIQIIGLGFKSQVGKDTVAEYLCEKYGYTRRGFGDELKILARETFDLSPEDVWTAEGKGRFNPRWGMTNGEILQVFGEQMRQQWGLDFWVNRLRATMARWWESDGTCEWVVPDVRHVNELGFIRNQGGVCAHVRGPRRSEDGRDLKHITEVALEGYEGWDWVFDNNGTIPDLHDQVRRMVRELKLAD